MIFFSILQWFVKSLWRSNLKHFPPTQCWTRWGCGKQIWIEWRWRLLIFMMNFHQEYAFSASFLHECCSYMFALFVLFSWPLSFRMSLRLHVTLHENMGVCCGKILRRCALWWKEKSSHRWKNFFVGKSNSLFMHVFSPFTAVVKLETLNQWKNFFVSRSDSLCARLFSVTPSENWEFCVGKMMYTHGNISQDSFFSSYFMCSIVLIIFWLAVRLFLSQVIVPWDCVKYHFIS